MNEFTLEEGLYMACMAVATSNLMLADIEVMTSPQGLAALMAVNLASWFALPKDLRDKIIEHICDEKDEEHRAFIIETLSMDTW